MKSGWTLRLLAILAVGMVVIAVCIVLLRPQGSRQIADVPLAQQLLDSPTPEGGELRAVAEKFYALGFAEEGDRLLNYPRVRALLPLLGKGTPAAATVRDVLAMPETSDQGLQQLRDSLLDQTVSAKVTDTVEQELPDLKLAIEPYGTDPTPPEHVQGALWRTQVSDRVDGLAARPLWLVTLAVTQHLGRPVSLRLALRGGPSSFLFCRTGVLAPAQLTTVVCAAPAGILPNGQPADPELPKLVASGSVFRPQSIEVVDTQGFTLADVTRGADAERQARTIIANSSGAAVAYVSCRQRGDCARTFVAAVFNPGSIGFLLVAAGMIWSVRWRWRGQYAEDRGNPFKPVFAIYLILVLLAIPIDLLDSRAAQGGAPLFTGLLSTAYNMILAMPWMAFRMQQISHVSGAALVGGPEADIVLSWIFMLANLAWLWCMAYPPAPARRGARM
jgi:hypothetical protein